MYFVHDIAILTTPQGVLPLVRATSAPCNAWVFYAPAMRVRACDALPIASTHTQTPYPNTLMFAQQ
jgi:hypothetical protein